MSLRSIDLQVLLPQVSEVNKNQPIQNQQSHTQQQQFAAQLEKQTETQRQQVQSSNKSEEGKINQETGSRQRGQDAEHRENRKRQEAETKVDVQDPTKGKILDIKI